MPVARKRVRKDDFKLRSSGTGSDTTTRPPDASDPAIHDVLAIKDLVQRRLDESKFESVCYEVVWGDRDTTCEPVESFERDATIHTFVLIWAMLCNDYQQYIPTFLDRMHKHVSLCIFELLPVYAMRCQS